MDTRLLLVAAAALLDWVNGRFLQEEVEALLVFTPRKDSINW